MVTFLGHYARIACGSVIYGRDSQHYRESAASCGESVVFSRSDSRSGAGPADFAQPLSQNCPPKGGSTGFDRKMQMGFSSASILVPKSMGTEAGLGWVGPGWAALGWGRPQHANSIEDGGLTPSRCRAWVSFFRTGRPDCGRECHLLGQLRISSW